MPQRTPTSSCLRFASETGVIGLLGYLVLGIVFFRSLGRLEGASFRSVYPFALMLIVALFPLSGQVSFYGVRSTGLIWWIIIANACAFSIASRQLDRNSTE